MIEEVFYYLSVRRSSVSYQVLALIPLFTDETAWRENLTYGRLYSYEMAEHVLDP